MMEVIRILIAGKYQEETGFWRDLLLAEASGRFSIDCVSSFYQAQERMTNHLYDVYLFSNTLDDCSGLDLFYNTSSLRQGENNYFAKLPCLFILDENEVSQINQLLEAGVSACLIKQGLTAEILIENLQRVIRQYHVQFELFQHRQMFEKLNLQLAQRNNEIQQFYYTLSHELKSPLTSVREFIAIIADKLCGEINEEQEKYLHFALDGCDQIAKCVNDLLDITRIETGKMAIQLVETPIDHLIEKVIRGHLPQACAKRIQLKKKVANDLLPAYVDPHRISQVLQNLVDNAVKFTPEFGEILISAKHHDHEFLAIEVRDTGRGIASEKLPFIFERLYQAETTDTSKEAGLGLGLNICRELVRLHNGEINVTSQVGQGSVFQFTLPIFNAYQPERRKSS
ncbi:MAG: hypothetical protein KIT27_04315 [Legionellales bacterium]|nr:hypothetical protein [Legionellales bacterium]